MCLCDALRNSYVLLLDCNWFSFIFGKLCVFLLPTLRVASQECHLWWAEFLIASHSRLLLTSLGSPLLPFLPPQNVLSRGWWDRRLSLRAQIFVWEDKYKVLHHCLCELWPSVGMANYYAIMISLTQKGGEWGELICDLAFGVCPVVSECAGSEACRTG